MRHIMRELWRAAASGLAVLVLCGSVAEARIFTDAFSGQGEACWGNLFIRTKTIEWDTQFSVCQSPYTILKKTFAEKPADYDYILYKLNRPGSVCRFRYIGLYYFDYSDAPGYANHWQVMGFLTFQAYRRFQYKQVVSGTASPPGDVLACDLPIYTGGNQTNISY